MPVVPVSPTRPRLPAWFKRSLPEGQVGGETREVLRRHDLVTVCEEATCPNRQECWSKKVATFMLMGHACTRTCTFCDVDWVKTPPPLDATEPIRVAAAVAELGLSFVVLTSVNRDDLVGGGASHFVAAIQALRARIPGIMVEVLTPDFCGDEAAIAAVVAAKPTVYNHNLTRPSPVSTQRCVRRRAIGARSSCSSASRTSILGCGPRAASWSGSARPTTRCAG